MPRPIPTWAIIDHMCRHCGGRILVQRTGGGPSGGGNPRYLCSLCGEGGCAMGPGVVCWCGAAFRGGEPGAFMCVSTDDAKDDPALESALAMSGIIPHHHEYKLRVGVVGTYTYRDLRRKADGLDE